MYVRIISAFLTIILLLGSCSSPEELSKLPAERAAAQSNEANETAAAFPYTFTDNCDSSVTLDKKPETIAVLFSSYADIWVSAGGSVDITVGETVERGFAPAAAVLVDSGAGHTSIDLETLISSEPDLVIGTADYACQTEAADFCRKAGIPAALFKVESFNDYLGALKIFCDLTGHAERYDTYGTEVEQRISAYTEKVSAALASGEVAAPEILFVRAGSSAKSTKAKTTADNFVCAMLAELGGINIADSKSELNGSLSLEAVVDGDPDYLFISTMGDEAAAIDYMTSLFDSEGWRTLTCVSAGNYSFLPKSLFHFKPNSRWAESYEYLIRILYPEVDID